MFIVYCLLFTRLSHHSYCAHPSKEDLEMTAKLLCNEIASGSRVVICVGYRGVKYSGALLELAEALGAPILTSLDAKGTVPEDHPLVTHPLNTPMHTTLTSIVSTYPVKTPSQHILFAPTLSTHSINTHRLNTTY